MNMPYKLRTPAMLTKLIPDASQRQRLKNTFSPSGIGGDRADGHAQEAMGIAETAVEVQKQLASVVLDISQRLASCLDAAQALQNELMRGVQDYIAFDPTGLDVPTMNFVQGIAEVFEDTDKFLEHKAKILRNTLSSSCRQTQKDCDEVLALIKRREEASSERQHYEVKLQQLRSESTPVSNDKLVRNEDKLQQARQMWEDRRQEVAVRLEVFHERRTVQTRMTLHALLHNYMQLIAEWGGKSQAMAEAFNLELTPGRKVEIVGLTKAKELNGTIVTLENVDAETGRCIVRTVAGEQKSVRRESLRPADDDHVSNTPPQQDEQVHQTVEQFCACDSPKDGGLEQPVDLSGSATLDSSVGNAAGATAACADMPATREQADKKPQISPTEGPGDVEQEVEVTLETPLDDPIGEVMVGGELAQILEASRSSARVRLAQWTGSSDGSSSETCSVEVRTNAWRRHVAYLDTRFRFYEPLGFGAGGRSIRLVQAPGSPPERAPQIAERTEGLLNGITLTAVPLRPAARAAQDAAGGAGSDASPRKSYYFEVEVLDADPLTGSSGSSATTRTLFVGFAWPKHKPDDAQESMTERWNFPETVSQMSRTFVVGGELPRFYFNGKALGKATGWRPRKEVGIGSVVGALLEVVTEDDENEANDVPCLRLTVFHNGVSCCTSQTDWPLDSGFCCRRDGYFHGVVDVCGSVRRVALRQDVIPPALPPAPEATPDPTMGAS